jgi:hypothetical protein
MDGTGVDFEFRISNFEMFRHFESQTFQSRTWTQGV